MRVEFEKLFYHAHDTADDKNLAAMTASSAHKTCPTWLLNELLTRHLTFCFFFVYESTWLFVYESWNSDINSTHKTDRMWVEFDNLFYLVHDTVVA